jgi:hypothetical protein
MSTPIAVNAVAGATILLFKSLISIHSFVGCSVCGYVGEGEHFPAALAGLESWGAQPVNKADRPDIPRSFS